MLLIGLFLGLAANVIDTPVIEGVEVTQWWKQGAEWTFSLTHEKTF